MGPKSMTLRLKFVEGVGKVLIRCISNYVNIRLHIALVSVCVCEANSPVGLF